jgi:hypothetical protein
MKRLYFEFINQYHGGSLIGFNPIGIELEYEKYEPSLEFKLVVMGFGFIIMYLCPWKTDESKYAEEMERTMGEFFDVQALSERDHSGDV